MGKSTRNALITLIILALGVYGLRTLADSYLAGKQIAGVGIGDAIAAAKGPLDLFFLALIALIIIVAIAYIIQKIRERHRSRPPKMEEYKFEEPPPGEGEEGYATLEEEK